MKTRTMYMHTLDGQPATFDPLWQIIHRVPASPRWVLRLVPSMAEAKAQQRVSRDNLRREGRKAGRYRVLRVEVPR